MTRLLSKPRSVDVGFANEVSALHLTDEILLINEQNPIDKRIQLIQVRRTLIVIR